MKEAEKERLKSFFDEGDPDEIFILEEEIASGSFGAVYKGRHGKTGKYYAVKIITPEEDEVLDDFMVEISVLRKCKHDNIVGYMGSWMKGEELFIAMEICDGGAVSDIFQISNDALTEDQIALITRESLKGLIYLHKCGIIHRDIKGANILLTTTGDIKLVDFGVSAELKNPGDKRNTLIGTPYWMAPEVISNKTGNVPYDTKSDIWSLGITLLELAERNPPLHEIHPMKALMMIPMREAPGFTHPEQWSKEFRDFIACCLVKSPDKRKNAEELLQHPFVTSCKPKQVLVDMVMKLKKAQKKEVSPEDDEDSSDDQVSEEEEEILPEPSSESHLKSSGSFVDSVRLSDSNSGSPASSPWQTRKPVPETNGSPAPKAAVIGEKTPISPARSADVSAVSTPSTSTTTSPASSTLKKRPTEGTGTQRPGNPNRPTYRTGRNMTRREVKEHQKREITRQLMKRQLKDIRNQQQQHLNEQQKLQRAQQTEHEKMTSRYVSQIQTKQRTTTRDLDTTQKKNKDLIDTLIKTQTTQVRDLKKQQVSGLKTHMKTQEVDLKKVDKEFKDQLKNKSKDFKNVYKEKEKAKLGKKELKQLKSEQEWELSWDEMLFAQKQARNKQQIEFDKKQQMQDEQCKFEREQLEKRLQSQWEHLEHNQKFVYDSLVAVQALEKEQMTAVQPLEVNHLQDKHALGSKQLIEQQQIETAQQRDLLIGELKKQAREFKLEQQKENTDLTAQIKVMSKDKSLAKRELKVKETDAKNALKAKHAKENAEFEEKQKKQKDEEEELIRNFQSAKKEQRRLEQEDEMKKLRELHEQDFKRLNDEHTTAEKTLVENQLKEREDTMEEQHKAMKDLEEQFMKQLEVLLQEYRSEQERLLSEQHAEQITFREKHPVQNAEELAQLRISHDEEHNILAQRQAKEKEMFLQQIDVEREQLDQELQRQKKTLTETGKRKPRSLEENGH